MLRNYLKIKLLPIIEMTGPMVRFAAPCVLEIWLRFKMIYTWRRGKGL